MFFHGQCSTPEISGAGSFPHERVYGLRS